MDAFHPLLSQPLELGPAATVVCKRIASLIAERMKNRTPLPSSGFAADYMYINEYTYNKITHLVQATGDRAIIAPATDLVKVRLRLLYISNKRLLLDSDDPMVSPVARRENVSLASTVEPMRIVS